MTQEFETVKIARSSGIGGIICLAVALYVSPSFWWLGLIGGFAGGYLAYEFREVLRAIPAAATAARASVGNTTTDWVVAVANFFRRPHPIIYPSIPFALVLGCQIVISIVRHFDKEYYFTIRDLPIMACCSFILIMVISAAYGYLAIIGAFCIDHAWFRVEGLRDPREVAELENSNLFEMQATYLNIARWAFLGIVSIVCFPFWLIKHLFPVLVLFFVFGMYHLICIVHSDKRMLCGLSGATGGAVCYMLLVHPGMTALQMLVVVLLGGLTSAALGIVSWAHLQRFFQSPLAGS